MSEFYPIEIFNIRCHSSGKVTPREKGVSQLGNRNKFGAENSRPFESQFGTELLQYFGLMVLTKEFVVNIKLARILMKYYHLHSTKPK